MNDMKDPMDNVDTDRDDIAPLIRMAGAREGVDANRQANAHANVARHWLAGVDDRARQRKTRRFAIVAAAASVVVAVTLGLALIDPAGVEPVQAVADINRVIGEAYADGDLLERGARLESGATVETREGGRLALDLEDGQVMRVDDNSRLVALGFFTA